MILERLFRSRPTPGATDGLTQPEREAILDLLLLGIFVDNHLSLAENKVIQDECERFDWDSGTSADIYIQQSTARIRDCRHDPQRQDEALDRIAGRLPRPDTRRMALSLLDRLFLSDGQHDPGEQAFLDRVTAHLAPPGGG